ncbi:MAG: hypothetical protein QXE12_05210 [Conexivisphaerales archaeon]
MRKTQLFIIALTLLGLLAILPAGISFTYATSPSFTQCPPVGFDTGCAILILINPDGTVSVLSDSTQGPFDGIEDTLVGVQDNCASCGTITSLNINGSNIFGFDGDGACTGSYSPNPPANDCPSASYQSSDPGDYESNNVTFTTSDNNQGTVVFSPGLTNGTSAWFSLESALSSTSLSVTPPTPSHGVPQFPLGMLILLAPLAGAILVIRNRFNTK